MRGSAPTANGRTGVLSRRQFGLLLAGGFLLKSCRPAAGDFEIIDFHSHFLPSGFSFNPPPTAVVPPEIERAIRDMGDPERLRAAMEDQGVDLRVINAPLEIAAPAPGESRVSLARRLNDALAEFCAESGGRLLGLASIDAFAGDEGAIELTRAVEELGLAGAFVESAFGDYLISSTRARPTLEAASQLGAPVFVHPVNDPTHTVRFDLPGFFPLNLGRASITATALAGMIESGVFEELPNLRVCFTTFAITSLLFGGLLDMTRPDAPEILRRNVYVDTIGVNATLIRAVADVVGIERVVVGTDWPIFSGYSVRSRLVEAARAMGLDNDEIALIAHANARRLLGLENA